MNDYNVNETEISGIASGNPDFAPARRQGEGITLNFKDFWDVFVERWWLIVVVAIIVTGAMYYRAKRTYVPKYSSTAVIHMSVQETEKDNVSFALGLSTNLIPDCEYCLTNRPTVEKAYERLKDQGFSYSEISGSMSTEHPKETRYINVTAVALSPEKAKTIVDTLCDICAEQMKVTAHGYNVVQIESRGNIGVLCNSVNFFDSLRIGIVAAVLVYAFFLVIRLFDDRFRDEADMEATLGTTILGTVPNANDSSSARRKKRYGYGKYKASYGYGYGYGYGKNSKSEATVKKTQPLKTVKHVIKKK